MSPEQPRAPERLAVFSEAAAIVTAAGGCLVLAGWLLDVGALKSVLPWGVTMKPSTALCFVALGVSLFLLRSERATPRARSIGQACASAAALVGLLTLSEYAFGWDLRIDQLLFSDPGVDSANPGRMSVVTALNLALVGAGLLLLDLNTRLQWWLAQILVGVVTGTSALALAGYVLGLRALYNFGFAGTTEMAIHTAALFVVLCAGVLAARPGRGFVATLTSATPGGLLARRLSVALFGGPLILGFLALEGRRVGLWDAGLAESLFALLTILASVPLIALIAAAVNRADEQRRKAQEATRALAESAVDAIVSADIRGEITYFNGAAAKMFGYKAGEAVGKPLTVLTPERFHPVHQAGFERFLRTGEAHVIGQTVELVGKRKTGEEFPAEVALSSWGSNGETFFTGILRDITGRKTEEEELGLAAAIIDTSDDAIIAKTTEGLVTTWNAGAEKLYGYCADEMLGRPVNQLIPDEREGEEQEILDAVLKGDPVEPYETQRMRKDGSTVDVSLTVSPIRNAAGELGGTSSIARDISELKRAHDEANRLKDEFLGLVSHDLRTPLTSIKGYLELLMMEEEAEGLSEEGRHFLQVISRNTGRLERLVGDLVFVAQVEAGEFSLEVADFDLTELAGECVEAARPRAEGKDIGLTFKADSLAACHGDRDRFAQVFDNMISNAIKYTPEGGRVDVRLVGENNHALLEVKDSGIGISEADQQRLFERFFRASNASDRMIPGAGLGLTIVKAIAEAHGGRVGVESKQGAGTIFRVEIPLSEGSQSKEKTQVENRAAA